MPLANWYSYHFVETKASLEEWTFGSVNSTTFLFPCRTKVKMNVSGGSCLENPETWAPGPWAVLRWVLICSVNSPWPWELLGPQTLLENEWPRRRRCHSHELQHRGFMIFHRWRGHVSNWAQCVRSIRRQGTAPLEMESKYFLRPTARWCWANFWCYFGHQFSPEGMQVWETAVRLLKC